MKISLLFLFLLSFLLFFSQAVRSRVNYGITDCVIDCKKKTNTEIRQACLICCSVVYANNANYLKNCKTAFIWSTWGFLMSIQFSSIIFKFTICLYSYLHSNGFSIRSLWSLHIIRRVKATQTIGFNDLSTKKVWLVKPAKRKYLDYILNADIFHRLTDWLL